MGNLGSIYKHLGDLGAAIQTYRKALALAPDQAELWFNLGNALQNDDPEESLAAYQRAIECDPTLGSAQFKLGKLFQEQENWEAAITSYRQAIALLPAFAPAYMNLGNVLKKTGDLEEAISLYQLALGCQPDYGEAYYNLGNAYLAQHLRPEAITAFRQAIRYQPTLQSAWVNLAMVLQQQGEHDQALACLEALIQQDPSDAMAYCNLGSLCNDLARYDQSILYLEKAIQLDPTLAMAHSNLAYALASVARLTEAVHHCRQALEFAPKLTAAHLNLGYALSNQGLVEEGILSFEAGLEVDPDCQPLLCNRLYSMNYSDRLTPEVIAEAHRHYGQRMAQLFPPYVHPVAPATPKRPLRVGYVSPDLFRHSVSYFLDPLLAHQDPNRVTIFCYSDVATPDPVTERLKSLSYGWRDTKPLSDEELFEQILKDQIDLLVDLTGHTGKNRLQVFARKPAPVQVTYLGYPNTSGLTTMDYRLTDSYTDPPGLTESLHTETLLRLPGCFLCYQPLTTAPEVLDLPAKRMGRMTFGSFNNLPKLTPTVIALWSQILHAVPTARLILKVRWLEDEPTRQRYLDLFAKNGIPTQRVKLIGLIPDPDHHLNFYNNIDIALDPFPYNGTATTCEALWMGVPVLTLAGSHHVSRVGLSLLNAVGLPEFVTHSAQEYVATAAKLANDLNFLASVRAKLRPQMAESRLCDGVAHAKAVEAAFEQGYAAVMKR